MAIGWAIAIWIFSSIVFFFLGLFVGIWGRDEDGSLDGPS